MYRKLGLIDVHPNIIWLLCCCTGHHVPQLSEVIFDKNTYVPKKEYINFKGFMVIISLITTLSMNYLDYFTSNINSILIRC